MNRRSFFSFLGGVAVVATDPEAFLWTPGRKLISIPTYRIPDPQWSEETRVTQYRNPTAKAIFEFLDDAVKNYWMNERSSPPDEASDILNARWLRPRWYVPMVPA